MNELTEEQKEKAVQRYLYCKDYYKQYQKEHLSVYAKSSKKYADNIKLDPVKLEEFKNKKKNIIKEQEKKDMKEKKPRNCFKKTQKVLIKMKYYKRNNKYVLIKILK